MRYTDKKGVELCTPPDIYQSTKGKLTKDMARIIRAEVDESKMGEEEREYWGGGKECWCRFCLMIFWMRRTRQ